MTDISASHDARQRDLDPLLAAQPPLDPDAPGWLAAEVEPGRAQAVAEFEEVAPDSLDAVWGALRRHRLDLRSDGPDLERAQAVSLLLDRWLERVAADAEPGDWDTSMRISLPTRDIVPINALYAHGFAPTGIRAVRLAPAVAPPAPVFPQELRGAVVRLAVQDDCDRLGALDARLLALDAHFAGVTAREGADATFADAYRERLGRAPDTTWVLERDGEITGFVHVTPDEASPEPDSEVLSLSGGQYLVVMYLDESERGSGAGAAFIRLVHDALDAAGTPYILLSYAVANPRSGPFWTRMGYRPVITEWQRRPAMFADPRRI